MKVIKLLIQEQISLSTKAVFFRYTWKQFIQLIVNGKLNYIFLQEETS